jgi:hypothetical protein
VKTHPALERSIREAQRWRPRFPAAINTSDLVDRRRGAMLRRFLRLAQDKRRATALAARRGLPLWGDAVHRFEQLFIEQTPRATWLLDERGHPVAWLGGGETVEMASLAIPLHLVPRVRQRLHEIVTGTPPRRPKRRGRPLGRRNTRPRLVLPEFPRRAHHDLGRALRQADKALPGLGSIGHAPAAAVATLQDVETPTGMVALCAVCRAARHMQQEATP